MGAFVIAPRRSNIAHLHRPWHATYARAQWSGPGCSFLRCRSLWTLQVLDGSGHYDISGAHATGMRGLGVLWGCGTRDELETAGADQLVGSPADLARTVLSMVNGKESPG